MQAISRPVFLPIEIVVSRFAAWSGAPVAELQGPAQTREISRMRQECMWLLRQVTTATMGQIGKHLGDRSAMTVDEGIDRVTMRAARDPHYRERLNDLLAAARGAAAEVHDTALCAAIGVLSDSALEDGDARTAALSILRGAAHG